MADKIFEMESQVRIQPILQQSMTNRRYSQHKCTSERQKIQEYNNNNHEGDQWEGNQDNYQEKESIFKIKLALNQSISQRQIDWIEDQNDKQKHDFDPKYQLEFQEDIYSLTFITFIVKNDPLWHQELMMKCFFTSILQIALGLLVVRESGEFDFDEATQKMNYIKHGQTIIGTVSLNATRFLCTLLLHLMVMPEIRSGMSMLEYAVYNYANEDYKFKSRHKLLYPMIIAIMKIMGGLMTEGLNMWMMGYASTEDDVVKDFIAFGSISSIDDIIVFVIKPMDVEQAVQGHTFNYQVVNYEDFQGSQFCLFIHKFLKFLYVGIYFYFFPFFVIIMVFVYGDDQLQKILISNEHT